MTMHALLEAEPGAASVKQVQSPQFRGNGKMKLYPGYFFVRQYQAVVSVRSVKIPYNTGSLP